MKAVLTTSFALVLIISYATAIEYGNCVFRGTTADPGIEGYATFVTDGSTVSVTINVNGITNDEDAPHGVHVHEFGDLSDIQAGLSVGGHYNPDGAPHGCPENGPTRHAGDMGNWQVSGGVINETKNLDLLELTGGQSIIGRAVVIHATTDNCINVTSAGSRLAFCVIGIGSPSLAPVPDTSNTASSGAVNTTYAICHLTPTTGNTASGVVYFSQQAGSATIVTAIITGIDGEHGFHIHQYGDLTFANNASSSGSHYDPFNTAHHSIPIPGVNNRHAGDMGNIYYYDTNGTAYYQYTNNLVNLTGANNVIGRAVILHADRDNCSQPIGFSGSRLAHCVIGITNAAPPALPAGVPTDQEYGFCPDAPATTGAAATTGASGATDVTGASTTNSAATTGSATTGSTTDSPVTTGGNTDPDSAAVTSGGSIVGMISFLVITIVL